MRETGSRGLGGGPGLLSMIPRGRLQVEGLGPMGRDFRLGRRLPKGPFPQDAGAEAVWCHPNTCHQRGLFCLRGWGGRSVSPRPWCPVPVDGLLSLQAPSRPAEGWPTSLALSSPGWWAGLWCPPGDAGQGSLHRPLRAPDTPRPLPWPAWPPRCGASASPPSWSPRPPKVGAVGRASTAQLGQGVEPVITSSRSHWQRLN